MRKYPAGEPELRAAVATIDGRISPSGTARRSSSPAGTRRIARPPI